jgi:hypothetical protein
MFEYRSFALHRGINLLIEGIASTSDAFALVLKAEYMY